MIYTGGAAVTLIAGSGPPTAGERRSASAQHRHEVVSEGRNLPVTVAGNAIWQRYTFAIITKALDG